MRRGMFELGSGEWFCGTFAWRLEANGLMLGFGIQGTFFGFPSGVSRLHKFGMGIGTIHKWSLNVCSVWYVSL